MRDVDEREADFLVTIDCRPWLIVEVKMSYDRRVSRHLRYFSDKLHPLFAYQVVYDAGVDVIKNGIRVMSADIFLSGLV